MNQTRDVRSDESQVVESEGDARQAQLEALHADPRLLMSTLNPIRAALWLVLLRPESEVIDAKSPSAHPLLAFAEALVRAALHGRLRAIVEIANRIEGRVANEFEAQPFDDGPAARTRGLMIEMASATLKKSDKK